MPDFPRYDSQRALTTEKPLALRDDVVAEDSAGKLTKATTNALAGVQDSMVKYQAFSEKVQQDTALYNYKIGAAEISNRAVEDTNIQNEGLYQKQLLELQKNSVKGISSERVKNGLSAEMNYMNTVAAIGIQTEFRKKTLLHGQAVAQSNLDTLAMTPGNDAAIKSAVKDAVKTGYWDETTAYSKEKSALEKMRQNHLISTINDNPKEAKKMIAANTFGFDPAGVDTAWKVYDRQIKEVQGQNEQLLMQQRLDGTLKEDVVRDWVDKEKIDAKTGISMIKDVNTVVQPQATELDKVAAFNKLVAMRDALKDKDLFFWTNSTFTERAKYRAEIFDAHRKGLISDDELEKDFLTQELSDKFMGDKVFQNAMKQVNGLSNNYQKQEDKDIAKAMMSKDLMRKVMDGMAPDEALQVVSAERIQADFPDARAEDLLYSAKKYGKPVWEIYKLRKK